MNQTIDNKGGRGSLGGQKPNRSVIAPSFARNSMLELSLWAVALFLAAVSLWVEWRPPEWALMVAAAVFAVLAVCLVSRALRDVRSADRVYWQNGGWR